MQFWKLSGFLHFNHFDISFAKLFCCENKQNALLVTGLELFLKVHL